jgi:hypothetical protein
MPIFIAREYGGKTRDIVLARSYDLANVYWQGKGIVPHDITTFTEVDLSGHPTGVVPILNTRKKTLSPFGKNSEEFIIVEN